MYMIPFCKSCNICFSQTIILLYRIMRIVRGRKLSQITFIDVICDFVLANPELRRQQYSLTDRDWSMLCMAISRTDRAFLHGYPCTLPCMYRPCFPFFLPPQIMEKAVWPSIWSRKTISCWPIIIVLFLIHRHWINPQKILCWEIHFRTCI